MEKNIALEQDEIIYGVLRYASSSLTLNLLTIIGKYFLYNNAVHDEKRTQFTDFVTLVKEERLGRASWGTATFYYREELFRFFPPLEGRKV